MNPSERTLVAQSPQARQTKRIALIWLSVVTVVLLAAGLLRAEPGQGISMSGPAAFRFPELCSSRRMFGLSCPGCGLTRSIVSAVHGHVRESWTFHPVGLITLGILLAQVPLRIWQFTAAHTGRRIFDTTKFDLWLLLSWQVALFTVWCARWWQDSLP